MVALQPNGFKTPIFCTHAIGTSVQFYRILSNYLGKDQPFYALQSRFLEQSKSKSNLTIEDMASFYIQEIRSIQAEGPYLLGGYSFGGIVIYEIAQQLLKSGQDVAMLAIFDTTAPGGYKRLSRLEQIYKHGKNLQESGLSYAAEKVFTQLKFQVSQIQKKTKRPVLVDKNHSNQSAFFKSRLRQIEALHLKTLENYQMQKYSGRISLFRTCTRPDNVGDQWDKTLGWDNFVGDSLEIFDLPGKHSAMFKEPNVQVLAKRLSQCIDQSLVNFK